MSILLRRLAIPLALILLALSVGRHSTKIIPEAGAQECVMADAVLELEL